jgi:hypothetical protein
MFYLLYTGQLIHLYLCVILFTVQCVVYSSTKYRGMISSVHLFRSLHIFRRSFFNLSLIYLYIDLNISRY